MQRKTVIATLAAVVVLGAGTATAVAVSTDGGTSAPASRQAPQRVGTATGGGGSDGADTSSGVRVTIEEAVAAARADTSGTVTSAELDDDGPRLVWEVDIHTADGTEHEITVNSTTGAVLDSRIDED